MRRAAEGLPNGCRPELVVESAEGCGNPPLARCQSGKGGPIVTTKPLDSHASVVICPHCAGVLLGRWEVHLSGCPASSTEHACGQCEQAMDNFAKQRV